MSQKSESVRSNKRGSDSMSKKSKLTNQAVIGGKARTETNEVILGLFKKLKSKDGEFIDLYSLHSSILSMGIEDIDEEDVKVR